MTIYTLTVWVAVGSTLLRMAQQILTD